MARTSPYNQNCPIARTLDVIGDRWTLLIIRDLFLGRSRFNEFRQSTPRISPKLLSQRLKRLEERGLVERALLDGYPPRAEYRLTPKGRSIFPVLFAMGSWGFEHLFADEPELRVEIDQYLRSTVPEYTILNDASEKAAQFIAQNTETSDNTEPAKEGAN
jgi:DNA-binding HxlR family transcriptional regulator